MVGVGLEVVAEAAVRGQRDQGDRRAAVDAAVGQLAADDDGAGFGGGQAVARGQGEPVAPGVGECGGLRVAGRPGRGELRAEPGGLLVRRLLQVVAARRVHVAGVGQHVGGRFELGQVGGDAVPAEQQHRGEVGADQVERVVAGQGFRGLVQLLESLLPLGRGAQREFAAGTAAVRRGELAPAVQDAADPGLFGVHRQPGPAGLLVKPADQRQTRGQCRAGGCQGRPVNSSRTPRSSNGTGASGCQADHDRAHGFRVCHALIMRADVSSVRSDEREPGPFG